MPNSQHGRPCTSCQKDAIISHHITQHHTLSDLLTYAHGSFRWTEMFPQTHRMCITTNHKRSNIHFAIQNRRKHVNEHAKQHTGQSMRRFGSKTATLYMQEEALRAQNIKETLTQQLRDISHALILSSARTHTHIFPWIFPNLEVPLLPFMAVIIKYILRPCGHAEDRQQLCLKSMCRFRRKRCLLTDCSAAVPPSASLLYRMRIHVTVT